MNYIFNLTRLPRRGKRFTGASAARHGQAARVSGLAASVFTGASLLLGLPTHARATDIYTASYGGTNDTGGTTPTTSGTYSLNTFIITGVYGSGSSETLFVTDGTANARIYGTAPSGATVGKEYTATVTASLYQGTEEFKSATSFTLQSTTATVTPQSATLAQVANTVNSGTANQFTASPADSLYASEGKLLFAPVTFTITPTTTGSLSTTSSTTLTDSSTGDTVLLYKSGTAFSYTAGKTYTVTGYEQPFNGTGTVESEIVGTTALTLYTPPPTALYRQTTSGSWVPSGGTDWSSAAAGPGNTGWINDGTITAFFQKAPTGTITINGGNINATGLEFDTTGYSIASDGLAADTLTLQNAGLLTVTNSTDTATVSAPIAGSVGLTKTGNGTLVLSSTTSTFTGSVTIAAGALSIGADANLGAAANVVALSGGTLQTTTGFSTARGFTGTGSLDVAPSTVLASTGAFSTTGVTLVDTGTLDLQGSSPSAGNLASSSAGTLESTTGNTVAITGLTAPNLTSGVATISAALTYAGSTSITATVGAGGELDVTGAISTPGLTTKGGNVYLAKQGAGTLDLYGNNSGLFRVEIGSATSSTPSPAGTININNANSLGANQLFFNAGTLNATATLRGTNALTIGASLGALSNAPAVFSGNALAFAGASAFYESTSATAPLANALTVNNTTIFSGVLSSTTAQTATSLGVLVNGTGTLRLTGANTFTDPLTLSGGVTLDASTTGGQALGGTTKITANAGGTLLLSMPNQVNTAAPIVLNTGTISIVSGANHGSGATLSGGSVSGTSTVGLGALTLAGNSTLSYTGTAATAVFSSFDPTNAGAGTYTLNVTGSNFGTTTDSADGTNNRLIFNQNIQSAGFLGDILFNGVADATETPLDNGFYEVTPTMTAVPEPATIFGGLALLGVAGWNQRRRFRNLLTTK